MSDVEKKQETDGVLEEAECDSELPIAEDTYLPTFREIVETVEEGLEKLLPQTPEGKRTDYWNEPGYVPSMNVGSQDSTDIEEQSPPVVAPRKRPSNGHQQRNTHDIMPSMNDVAPRKSNEKPISSVRVKDSKSMYYDYPEPAN